MYPSASLSFAEARLVCFLFVATTQAGMRHEGWLVALLRWHNPVGSTSPAENSP